MSDLKQCRVVLVRTHYAGNLGSAARVMRNFGLRQLVLVDPIADKWSMDAVMMAMGGRDLLEAATIVPTLAEAVSDCTFVMATSGETGGLTRKGFWGTPEEQVPELLTSLDHGPVALVFGPEPSGLTMPEIALCHGSIFVPTDTECPSLNLAQAVAVCLYELRRQWLKRSPVPVEGLEPPAPFIETEPLYENLREALTDVRFLWDFRSGGIFHVIRHVLSRARMTSKEVKLLHGLARQLKFIAREYGVPHPSTGKARPSQSRQNSLSSRPGESSPTAT
ncbi:MAG: RNA methyltransferase [Bacteroidales bacterium]|nr:RNA methyltransferase [Bacteroidales bacterium]